MKGEKNKKEKKSSKWKPWTWMQMQNNFDMGLDVPEWSSETIDAPQTTPYVPNQPVAPEPQQVVDEDDGGWTEEEIRTCRNHSSY